MAQNITEHVIDFGIRNFPRNSRNMKEILLALGRLDRYFMSIISNTIPRFEAIQTDFSHMHKIHPGIVTRTVILAERSILRQEDC